MASVAERKRRRKKVNDSTRAVDRAINDNAKALGVSPSPTIKIRKPSERREDGIDYLLAKQRVSRAQADAGRDYGSLYRTAQIEGSGSLRSCLDDTPRGSGGGALPTTDLEAAAWIADCRIRLAAAQAALGFHSGMIAACDLVCGRGLRPREITDIQRETEEIETGLRVALDLLIRHFAAPRER